MSRNILITGGNSGIGLEMAQALAGHGDRVVIAARSETKSNAAISRIQAQQPEAQIESMQLDLADFAQIDRFSEELLTRMPVIDVMILNAGLYTLKLQTLANGYEAMMGIMHFGHFRLVQNLLDAVKAAPRARIIVTSSMMHKIGKINQASFTNPSRHRTGMGAYGQAKLANLLFTRELARRLQGSNITVNAFHPGAVATEIYRDTPSLAQRAITSFMLSPKQGADTGIWLATATELDDVSGGYFVKRKLKRGSALSRDEITAKQLWRFSEQAMASQVTAESIS